MLMAESMALMRHTMSAFIVLGFFQMMLGLCRLPAQPACGLIVIIVTCDSSDGDLKRPE